MSACQSKEVKEIYKTLNYYSDAYKKCDISKITNFMYPEVRFIRISPKTNNVDIEYRKHKDCIEKIQTCKKNKVKFTTTVESIDITGLTASVRMTWIADTSSSDYYGYTTDYLMLVKADSQWKIINKLCNSERKKKSMPSSFDESNIWLNNLLI